MTDEERLPVHMPSGVSLPARERIRAAGVWFTNYHVAAVPCTPSRSVLFTGLHATENGMIDNTPFPYVGDMDPAIPTVGTMLATQCHRRGRAFIEYVRPNGTSPAINS